MPHFCRCGGDEVLCQECGQTYCCDEACTRYTRVDWTRTSRGTEGNVCSFCLKGMQRR